MYRMFLEDEGYDVIIVPDGEECVKRYKKAMSEQIHFGVVILDYRMPIKNGAEAAKKILKMNPLQPVIIATAYGSDLVRGQLPRHIRILQKPFDFDELINAINVYQDSTNPE